MECYEVRKKLSCYLDGVLDEATLEAVESHLNTCVECRIEFEALRVLTETAGEIEEIEPPSYLRTAIKESVRDAKDEALCEEVLTVLSEYVDGELAESKAALVKQHVAACESCVCELNMLVRVVSTVGMLDEVEPPADLRDRIAAAVIGRRPKLVEWIEGLWPKRVAWAAAGLAAAAVLAGLVSVDRPAIKEPVAVVKPAPTVVRKNVPEPTSAKVVMNAPKPVMVARATRRDARAVEAVLPPKPIAAIPHPESREPQEPTKPEPAVVAASIDKTPEPIVPVQKPETRMVKSTDQLNVPSETPKVEPPASPAEAASAKLIAELEASVEETKPEEPRPTLMKIAVAPPSRARDLHNLAQSLKKEVAARRNAQDSSTIRLFDKRF